MKLPEVKLPELPRRVAIALGIIIGSGALYGALLFTLGTAVIDATIANGRLKAEIADARQKSSTAQSDFDMVAANKEKFEQLMQSEKLIPHTRRDAARQLQAVALQHGISSLNYDFAVVADKAPAAVASQAKSDAYRVDVEGISLKIGSPLDGQIYNYVLDIQKDFPGTVILQSMDLSRAPQVTTSMLDRVSQAQDAGLVIGDVRLLWRTAQSKQDDKK
jgi:hypothetical protein